MRRDRFYRIIKEIKSGIVENGRDIKDIINLINEFTKKEETELTYFLKFENKIPVIQNKNDFEKFVKYYLGCRFEEYGEFNSKKELVKILKNTKAKNLHTSDITIIHRKRNELPQIFYDDFQPETSGRIVVIENYESFLRIDFNLFEEEDFIYLGGYSNKKTAEFLRDKDILFFGDFDFFGMMIFDSMKCKNKEFFIPENLEDLFKKHSNRDLYMKQRYIEENVIKIDEVYELIKKYSAVVEQEVLNIC